MLLLSLMFLLSLMSMRILMSLMSHVADVADVTDVADVADVADNANCYVSMSNRRTKMSQRKDVEKDLCMNPFIGLWVCFR
jgi:hypothetical protein